MIGKGWTESDNYPYRPNGTILQTGKNLYIVYALSIYNKEGKKMVSLTDSLNYCMVGRMVHNDWQLDTWYDESMLRLRR